MHWLLWFLPQDKKALLQLALRIASRIDTPEERRAIAAYGQEMLADGKCSVGEWAKLGSKLGILTGRDH
jgi:hypothetical protein